MAQSPNSFSADHWPNEIRYKKDEKILEIDFDDGATFLFPAEFLRVDYLVVIVAALVPTFLYFSTVYFMVHLEADKLGIQRIPREELPRFRDVIKDGWHLLLSLVVLVAFLIWGFTATHAAFWAILVLTALTFVNSHTRMSPVDLLLIEGFKHHAHPKLEIHRPAIGKALLQPDDSNIQAVAADAPMPSLKVPVLDLNDVPAIADFILEAAS